MNSPNPPRRTITFTRKLLAKLEEAHKKAHDAHEERFMFEGDEYYTKYAHYLIHYLKGELK